jgi:hypothetical protein
MTGLRNIAAAALTALLLTAPAAALRAAPVADQQLYIAGLGEIPLMPGLTVVEEESLVFDKPDGRIVEATLSGTVNRQAVRSYYQQIMPQLGWRLTATDRFEREGEILRMELVDAGHGKTPSTPQTTLRVTLKPR